MVGMGDGYEIRRRGEKLILTWAVAAGTLGATLCAEELYQWGMQRVNGCTS